MCNAKRYNLQPTIHKILLAQSNTLRQVKQEAHMTKIKKNNAQLDWINQSAKMVLGNKQFMHGRGNKMEMDLTKEKL
jgi:hypothetical protein